MAYTVLGSPISPFVRKVMVTLMEKNVPFEHVDVNPFAPPDGFRKVSPLGKIPAFRHDDVIVNDSSVICRYIERLNPKPPLYPTEPAASARAEWIEEYMDSGFMPVGGAKVFAPLVLRPLISGEAADEGAVRKVIDEELPPFFDYLEEQLGDADYFVGNAFSIADIAVGTVFVNQRLAGVRPSADRWPKLSAHLKRVHGRDSFKSVIEPVKALIGQRWVELD